MQEASIMEHEAISETLIQLLNEEITHFSISEPTTYKTISDKIGDARLVLLGEATHGTHEFYQTRLELSRLLISEKNFHAIAIEGDWTSTYPLNHYLQGNGKIDELETYLHDFLRFPKWMWRNKIFYSFLKWLRQYNDEKSEKKVGLYGLDLYCLSSSMQAVIDYLNINDPDAARKASKRYACFDHTSMDPQSYGYLTHSKLKKSCVEEVTEQLLEMQRIAYEKFHQDKSSDLEASFYATQNARIVKNAELYYRSLFETHEITWNIRDQHMADTLQNLMSHIETKFNEPAKIIIWAHNSHVGDARATEMSTRHEINLGQIVREHFSTSSFHLGFSTYTGTVTAASDWDQPAECKEIQAGMPGSYEYLFHKLKFKDFILDLHQEKHITELLNISRLQRAIGVIYRPETERYSHYFFTHLPYQFDAIIHIDITSAVTPLDN
jgi:erythromycin esterase-like protein